MTPQPAEICYNYPAMTLSPDSEEFRDRPIRTGALPQYTLDWDRFLNFYNIMELPVLPADGDPAGEDLPLGLRIMRELCLDAANAYALEVWFDFAPNNAENGVVDACWSSESKGTQCVRLPKRLITDGDDDLGIFGFILRNLSDDGMFAIHVSEHNETPRKKHNPWDKHGRLVPPPPKADPEPPDAPGNVETVTIRAFRVALKGNTIPNDVVIQICPRFWHMPAGLEVR